MTNKSNNQSNSRSWSKPYRFDDDSLGLELDLFNDSFLDEEDKEYLLEGIVTAIACFLEDYYNKHQILPLYEDGVLRKVKSFIKVLGESYIPSEEDFIELLNRGMLRLCFVIWYKQRPRNYRSKKEVLDSIREISNTYKDKFKNDLSDINFLGEEEYIKSFLIEKISYCVFIRSGQYISYWQEEYDIHLQEIAKALG